LKGGARVCNAVQKLGKGYIVAVDVALRAVAVVAKVCERGLVGFSVVREEVTLEGSKGVSCW